MIPLQIISLGFGLYMSYWSYLTYKKKLISVKELLFWLIIWILFIVVILLPESVKLILQTFKIQRTMDLLMIISFIILWIITYINYINNKQLKKKLQDLVRQDAIKKVIKK